MERAKVWERRNPRLKVRVQKGIVQAERAKTQTSFETKQPKARESRKRKLLKPRMVANGHLFNCNGRVVVLVKQSKNTKRSGKLLLCEAPRVRSLEWARHKHEVIVGVARCIGGSSSLAFEIHVGQPSVSRVPTGWREVSWRIRHNAQDRELSQMMAFPTPIPVENKRLRTSHGSPPFEFRRMREVAGKSASPGIRRQLL